MKDLGQINIKNLDFAVKTEFKTEAKKLKVSHAFLFEKMWKKYKNNYDE